MYNNFLKNCAILPAKEYSIVDPFRERIEYNPLERSSAMKLRLYEIPDQMDFLSSGNTSVFVFNETEYSIAIQTDWDWSVLNPKKVWANTTEVLISLSTELIHEEWGIENKTIKDPEIDEFRDVQVLWVVVVNEENIDTNISLKWQTENFIILNLNRTFEWIIAFTFLAFSVMLFVQTKKEKDNNEPIKAKIYFNYGLGLFFGALATGIWVIYRNIREQFPRVWWSSALQFEELPAGVKEVFSPSLLILLTILCLGGSMVFLSITVEQNIQQKPKPYFANFLIIMELIIVITVWFLKQLGNSPALDVIFVTALWIWIASLVLTVVNVALTYLKLTINSTGIIQKKSLLILLGLAFAFLMVGLRDFFEPQFIANSFGSLSVMVLYKGIILETEKI